MRGKKYDIVPLVGALLDDFRAVSQHIWQAHCDDSTGSSASPSFASSGFGGPAIHTSSMSQPKPVNVPATMQCPIRQEADTPLHTPPQLSWQAIGRAQIWYYMGGDDILCHGEGGVCRGLQSIMYVEGPRQSLIYDGTWRAGRVRDEGDHQIHASKKS
jgi:hypothetical protein